MKNTHKEKLIAAYLSGNTSASEEEELMSWVAESTDSQKFFDNAVELWDIADQGDYPDFSQNKSKAWDKLDTQLFSDDTNQSTAKVRPLLSVLFSRPMGIAASLALLLTAGWWLMSAESFSVQTFAAQQTMVELPDGTKVWMNEHSQLAYEDLGSERKLTFEGEAYFDVQTDSLKPFKIYSGRAVTTVLGTEFNLRAYPQESAVEVSVTEGKVALAQVDKKQIATQKIELTPGQTGIFEKDAAAVKMLVAEPAQNKTAWKDKKLNFDNLKLAQVLPVIERYFGVKIILENQNLLNCTLNGDYDNPELEEMLNILSFPFEFETEINENTIHLIGGSCQQ